MLACMLVHLDHAHRRRGAAVEVDDLAGIGVANAHIVDVVDLAAGGIFGECGGDGPHPFRRGIDAERQFRFQGLDMDIDLDVGAELLLDVPLQRVGDLMNSAMSPMKPVQLVVSAFQTGELACSFLI